MGAKPSGQSAAGAGSEDGSRALGRIRGNHLPGPVGQYLVERGLHVSQVVDLLEAVGPVTRRVVAEAAFVPRPHGVSFSRSLGGEPRPQVSQGRLPEG